MTILRRTKNNKKILEIDKSVFWHINKQCRSSDHQKHISLHTYRRTSSWELSDVTWKQRRMLYYLEDVVAILDCINKKKCIYMWNYIEWKLTTNGFFLKSLTTQRKSQKIDNKLNIRSSSCVVVCHIANIILSIVGWFFRYFSLYYYNILNVFPFLSLSHVCQCMTITQLFLGVRNKTQKNFYNLYIKKIASLFCIIFGCCSFMLDRKLPTHLFHVTMMYRIISSINLAILYFSCFRWFVGNVSIY